MGRTQGMLKRLCFLSGYLHNPDSSMLQEMNGRTKNPNEHLQRQYVFVLLCSSNLNQSWQMVAHP